ncbi:MAG: class I SAM-dependent methyltransferase [Pseudomonadota bacterium]
MSSVPLYTDLKYNLYLRFKYGLMSLTQEGWFDAFRRGGQNFWSQPWISFAAKEYLTGIVSPDDSCLEYGSGNSTRWLCRAVKSVRSIETDEAFANAFFRQGLPANCTLSLVEANDKDGALNDAYLAPLEERGYDVIFIDGRHRVACFERAIGSVRTNGVVVFDNLDRVRYAPARELITKQKIPIVPIRGATPFTDHLMTTAFLFPKGTSRLTTTRITPQEY